MAVLTTQSISAAGLSPVFSSAASADRFTPGDTTFLYVRNGNAGSVTVTINDDISRAPAGAAAFDPDIAEVIEPGGERMVGPLPIGRFRGEGNKGDFTTSPNADVDVAVIRV